MQVTFRPIIRRSSTHLLEFSVSRAVYQEFCFHGLITWAYVNSHPLFYLPSQEKLDYRLNQIHGHFRTGPIQTRYIVWTRNHRRKSGINHDFKVPFSFHDFTPFLFQDGRGRASSWTKHCHALWGKRHLKLSIIKVRISMGATHSKWKSLCCLPLPSPNGKEKEEPKNHNLF